jgi:hypothetical protein
MSDVIINGKKGCHQQPTRYGKNESGFYSVVQFEGTAKEIKIRAAAYDAIGAQYEVEEMFGGLCRLNVFLSWASAGQVAIETPVSVWEYEPMETEKDLLDADFPFANTYSGGVGEVSNQNKGVILKALADLPEDDTLPPAMYPDGTQDSSVSLYYLMRAGVRSYPVNAATIRHTQVVSNRYNNKVAFTNVGRLLSSATLVAVEGVPSDLLFDVPSEPSVTQYVEDAGDLGYAWRKLDPQITESAYQKKQITRRWQFGLWALKIHGSIL